MIFVTGNKNKVREFEEILGIKIENKDIRLDEIQSVDVEDVIKHKAEQAYAILKEPLIVEDTGLYFDELNGLPGALIKFFLKKLTLQHICDLIKENRNATARTGIAYFDGKSIEVFIGETKGKIPEQPRGDDGFGWDPIFIPEGHDKTFGEMSSEEKHAYSMRRAAIGKLRGFLKD